MIQFLDQGIQLPQPPGCPDDVYRVMLGCWRHDPHERFTSDHIHHHLRQLADGGTAQLPSARSTDHEYLFPDAEPSSSQPQQHISSCGIRIVIDDSYLT